MTVEQQKGMDSAINLTEAREFLITSVVPRANDILNRFFASGKFTSQQKEGVDFKTQADDAVDAFIIAEIQKKFPRTEILTEETAPKDYSSYKDKKDLWVVDPLDGTTNFSRGDPHFAISIALVDEGRTKLAVVSVPQSGEVYWAQDDSEHAIFNGEKITVSQTAELGKAVIGCDWGWTDEGRQNVYLWVGHLFPQVRAIKSMGSAVIDLAWLASGKLDAYVHSGLKPWDVAASSLLVQKSGGMITTPKGLDWNVFCPDILATNGVLHKKMLSLIA